MSCSVWHIFQGSLTKFVVISSLICVIVPIGWENQGIEEIRKTLVVLLVVRKMTRTYSTSIVELFVVDFL